MDTEQLEVKGVSDARLFGLLRRLWIHGHRREDVKVVPADWIQGFPDLMQLLEQGKSQGLIELYPTETEDRGYWIQDVTLLPSTLERLQSEPRSVHRQVTVDGQKIDLRSMVGRMIYETCVENLADACRIWLFDLKNERKATARRKVHILLSRTIGIRGKELATCAPELKAEIMTALSESK